MPGWYGSPRHDSPPLPWFTDLDGFEYATTRKPWDVELSREVEVLLDVSHLPFACARTIGREGVRSQEPKVSGREIGRRLIPADRPIATDLIGTIGTGAGPGWAPRRIGPDRRSLEIRRGAVETGPSSFGRDPPPRQGDRAP